MKQKSSSTPSSLAKFLPQSPTAPEELKVMAMQAWRQQGIALLRPDAIIDPWARQTVINEAERLYGERSEGGSRRSCDDASDDKDD